MADPAGTNPVELLPHRPPFRFVDSVAQLEPGERIHARYQVTGDEAFLAGHFPANPVFPGVIQLEAIAQAGAIALLSDPRYADKLPLFGGVEAVRFRRVVVPGDELELYVELERLSGRGGWGRGRATVDGQESCRARLLFAIAQRR
ncbi:MAG: 3-hydroxyacyl-ACP dehydratase FabZ [Actinomycetota bacterium]